MPTAYGCRYEGGWKGGRKHGQGTYTYAGGGKYVGDFVDDKRHGQGCYTCKSKVAHRRLGGRSGPSPPEARKPPALPLARHVSLHDCCLSLVTAE